MAQNHPPQPQLLYLRNHLPLYFLPHQQYLVQYPIALIVQPKPSFTPTHSLSLRNNLSIQKQLGYLRAAVKEDTDGKLISELLAQKSSGPVCKLGNCSVVIDDFLFWGYQGKINKIKISSILTKEHEKSIGKDVWTAGTGQGQLLVDLHQFIYQLTIVESYQLTIVESTVIRARTPRKILFIDYLSAKIVNQITCIDQITWCSSYAQQLSSYISTYHQNYSILSKTDINKNNQMSKISHIDGLVNSHSSFTSSDILVCNSQSIMLSDCRKKKINMLHHRQDPWKNRIYSSLRIDDGITASHYLAVAESFAVNIYDIRKCDSPVKQIKHYCQESPPQILQIYTGKPSFKQQNLKCQQLLDQIFKQNIPNQPILIAFSPYTTGSSLLCKLDLNNLGPHQLRNQFFNRTNKFSNKFQLLYDAGKIQQGYHPRSISPLMIESQLFLFHIDNQSGVALQLMQDLPLKKNDKSPKPITSLYQRVPLYASKSVESLPKANQLWFQRQIVDKQFASQQQDYWKNKMVQEQLQLQENTFENRTVRYADLKQFYHRLFQHQDETVFIQKRNQEKQAVRQLLEQQNKKVIATQQTQFTQSLNLNGNQAQQQFNKCVLGQEDINHLLMEWDQL